jgi:drug/metabolite transporter (DMT)-like permease
MFAHLPKVALWVCLSSSVILSNKFILTEAGFPFPVTLTFWHQGLSSVLAWFLHASKFEGAERKRLGWKNYFIYVMPIGLIFGPILWFGNAAYLTLSVSFVQMVKAFMPALVYFAGILFRLQQFSSSKLVVMSIIIAGTCLASYGELSFDAVGFSYLLSSLVLEAIRICLLQVVLQSPAVKLNPIQTLMYVSPLTSILLFIVALVQEWSMVAQASFTFSAKLMCLILLGNGLLAFALNLVMFRVIKDLDGLTVNIAGVVKDCVLICFSWSVFNSPLSLTQLCGYAVALVGVFKYNIDKLGIKISFLEKNEHRRF